MADNSIVKLGDLSKPATVLIQKISNAVGGLWRPFQIVRVAEAEAKAEQIRAESQVAVSEIQRRAMHRFVEEEVKKQSNMESVTEKALPHLREQASPELVEDDWIANFFDKSRIVSGPGMQELWARVLAGEANAPGAFARRTVNLLADLDMNDARLFEILCRFGWALGGTTPLVFDTRAEIYARQGIGFSSLSHLQSLGLIQFNDITGYIKTGLPRRVEVRYFEQPVYLAFPQDTDNTLEIGNVLLTRAGEELATVCRGVPVDGFFAFVFERWSKLGLMANVLADCDFGKAVVPEKRDVS